MEALSHRRAEVMDMGPVQGTSGRTRMSMTCPSRLVAGVHYKSFMLVSQIEMVHLNLSVLLSCSFQVKCAIHVISLMQGPSWV